MTPPPSVEDVLERFEDMMERIASLHVREFIGVDLTMPQAKVLYLVSVRPDISMSALASELRVGLSAISGLVDRLVAHGYLERHGDPSDRRLQLVTLTPHGTDALDRLRELRAEMMRQLLVRFSADELAASETTIHALDREVRRLEQLRTKPDPGHERTSA